jgi:hypothetical protein
VASTDLEGEFHRPKSLENRVSKRRDLIRAPISSTAVSQIGNRMWEPS